MAQQTQFYPLRGGLNLIAPAIETPPGHAIAGSNYECLERGYHRVDGYERFDGQLKPSEAGYWLLNFEDAQVPFLAGATVLGSVSGVTAKVLSGPVFTSGGWGSGGVGYVLLHMAESAALLDDFTAGSSLPSGNSLSRGSQATYFNSSGVLTTASSQEARFGYYWTGAAWARAGLLNEPARTNLIRNSTPNSDSNVGALPTPGALPSFWEMVEASNLNASIVSAATTGGVPYIDVRLQGTPNATSSIYLYLDEIDGIAARAGQNLTFSAFLSRAAGAWTNFRSLTALVLRTYDDAEVLVDTYASLPITDVSTAILTRQRREFAVTLGSDDIAYVRPAIRFSYTNGSAIDVTLRIGAPQLEVGEGGATSWIATTTAAASRNADVLTRTFDDESTFDITLTRTDAATPGTTSDVLEDELASEGAYVVPTSVQPLRTASYDDSRDLTDSSRELFVAGEDLTTTSGAFTHCTVTSPAVRGGASTDALDATYELAAVNAARAQIEKPPGTGPIRGIFALKNVVYCIRNISSREAALYRATDSGWQRQNLGWALAFTTGSDEIVEGEIISDGTGTATVTRVLLQSGAWDAGTAAGRIMTTAQDGVILGAITGSLGGAATVTGAGGWDPDLTQRNALKANGRYEIDVHNFFGDSESLRAYGCNGIGRAFEWDGEVFCEIHTGLSETLDKPQHIAAHRNNLFLSYRGGRLQFSATGDPYDWQVLNGAGEIGVGRDITALQSATAGVLAIFCTNRIGILYGSDIDDFQLDEISQDSGGDEWTVQTLREPIYLDARGLRQLSAAQDYGNFVQGSVSRMVEPLIRSKRAQGVTAVASLRVRQKDQYRLFWSDGTGLSVYFGRENPEIMPFELGVTPSCTWSGEVDGIEMLLMGTAQGWVYQLDAGPSFDGEQVNAFVRFPFNHIGSPQQNKRFHKATLEVDARPDAELAMVADVSYGHPDNPAGTSQALSVSGGGAFWDESDLNQYNWSSPVEGLAEAYVDAMGRNIAVAVLSQQTHEDPHTLHGMTIHFSYRGLQR